MKHWEEQFDCKNAFYFVKCGECIEHGPYKGIAAALEEMGRQFQETGEANLIEAHSKFDCATIWPDGRLMLSDLHDDEGNRLSHRMDWD